MSTPSTDTIIDALRPVEDPELHRSIVDLGMVRDVIVDKSGTVGLTTGPAGSELSAVRDRVRASFDPARSGDVVGLLDRAIVPIAVPGKGYAATHGSVWDYDRRVPLLFWRKGLAPFEQSAPVETVDIAPSLFAMLKLKVPDGAFDGRCLDLDAGAGNTCGGDQ